MNHEVPFARAAGAASMIAEELASPEKIRAAGYPRGWFPQSLAHGATGIAALHAVLGPRETASAQVVHDWLTEAVAAPFIESVNTGLFHGGPAISFVLETVSRETGADATAREKLAAYAALIIERRLTAADARLAAGKLPALAEFDVLRGLAGLGTGLLHRAPADPRLRSVLRYLVRLTEPVNVHGEEFPGWWSGLSPAGRPSPDFPGGHCNMGLAHGIAGPLALLATAARAGVIVDGHTAAIETICAWFDRWQQEGPHGPWWPNWITRAEFRVNQTGQGHAARPSWCYGAPGVIRALHLAAIAIGDHHRKAAMERAMIGVLDDGAQLSKLVDLSLCHGWSGLMQIAWRIACDAEAPELRRRVPLLLERVLDQDSALQDLLDPKRGDVGLLEGAAGVALALHTVASDGDTRWDSCFAIT